MSAAAANGVISLPADVLTRLAARLSDPQDREGYAELIAYLRSLPADDEFLKVAQLFGFLTLIGRDLPQALIEERSEWQAILASAYASFHEEIETSRTHYEQLQARLHQLPDEIAEGVKPEEIAKRMGEAFRQQIANTGMQETKTLLDAATLDLKKTTSKLDATVKPITDRFGGLATNIETQSTRIQQESAQLTRLANDLHDTNNTLRKEIEQLSNWIYAAVIVILLVIGFFVGATWQRKEIGTQIDGLTMHIDDLQQRITAAQAQPALPRTKTGKQSKR